MKKTTIICLILLNVIIACDKKKTTTPPPPPTAKTLNDYISGLTGNIRYSTSYKEKEYYIDTVTFLAYDSIINISGYRYVGDSFLRISSRMSNDSVILKLTSPVEYPFSSQNWKDLYRLKSDLPQSNFSDSVFSFTSLYNTTYQSFTDTSLPGWPAYTGGVMLNYYPANDSIYLIYSYDRSYYNAGGHLPITRRYYLYQYFGKYVR